MNSSKLRRQLSLHQHSQSPLHSPNHLQKYRHKHQKKHSSQAQNFDLIKQSSEPMNSVVLPDSHSTQLLPKRQNQHRKQSFSNEASSEASAATTAVCDSTTTDISHSSIPVRRRQAINITSNPGYQVCYEHLISRLFFLKCSVPDRFYFLSMLVFVTFKSIIYNFQSCSDQVSFKHKNNSNVSSC